MDSVDSCLRPARLFMKEKIEQIQELLRQKKDTKASDLAAEILMDRTLSPTAREIIQAAARNMREIAKFSDQGNGTLADLKRQSALLRLDEAIKAME
jgi:hypothetical protein